MTKPIAFILIGLPGSGKSTWSLPLLSSGQFDLISTDFFIEQEAKKLGLTYSDIFRDYVKEADKICNLYITEVISGERNLIWDQTNVSIKSRKSKIDKLKNYIKIAVVFEIDEELHKERLDNRTASDGKFIPVNVMDSMKKTFQFPTLEEGFNHIIHVVQ